MSIEKDLGRIADALEKIAAGLSAGLAATNSAEPPADKEPSKGSTRQRKNVEREDPPKQEEQPPAEEPADDLGLDDEPLAADDTFSEDDVRKALKNYRDINGVDAVMKVLSEQGGGATGMGSLKPENYAAVMAVVR